MAELEHIPEGDKKFTHPNSSNQVLYANGFTAGHSAFDMYIVGMLNGMPNFTVNMSFTTAKALKMLMDDVIETFEKNAQMIIPTSEEIREKLNRDTLPERIA